MTFKPALRTEVADDDELESEEDEDKVPEDELVEE